MREASYFDSFLCLFSFYKRYRVEGDSMLPTLKNGEIVLAKPSENLQIGDVVVANHPFRITLIIKRIKKISPEGRFFLVGDNPNEGTDSRTFGEIAKKDILGIVVARLS